MRGGLKNKNDQFRRLVRIQTGKKGVTEDEKNQIIAGLDSIVADVDAGKLETDK